MSFPRRRESVPYVFKKIFPRRITFLNEMNLPRSLPTLELSFSQESRMRIVRRLVIYQIVNVVFFGKTLNFVASVFKHSFF